MHASDGRRSETWLYVTTALLTLVLLVPFMRLDRADLSIPFSIGGDSTYYQGVIVKPLLSQPWYMFNPSLAAPDGLNLADFPTGTDSLLYLMMKIIAVFTRNAAMTVNLFYLLTFPLAALSMLYAARYLKISRPLAVAVAVLFAFAPYHFGRGEMHLALSAYFLLPLGLVAAMSLDRLLGPEPAEGDSQPRPAWRSVFSTKLFWGSCLLSAMIAISGAYYAAFYMVILVVIAGRRALARRAWASFVVPALLCLVVLGAAVASVAPTLIYQRVNGPNAGATLRTAVDAEVYSLQPAQLILPLENHRLAGFRAQAAAYRRLIRQLNPALNNEARLAWLGTLASLGFVFLLGLSLVRVRDPEDGPWARYRLGDLASVNLAMLVLGAVWGVGFLIAFWLTTMLRGYNRVSIVIAMVALLALGAVVDRYCRKAQGRQWVTLVAAILLLAIGLFDQTSAAFVPPYVRNKTAHDAQSAFGASAQKLLPAGSMVFQLPYTGFPGAGVELPAGYGDYDQLLPSIYSDGLKWSFGAIRGRQLANWQSDVAALPVPEMIERLRQSGWAAVYVDTLGYKDQGKAVVAELTAAIGEPEVRGSNGRMLLWRIRK